jgi:hypothetical protein
MVLIFRVAAPSRIFEGAEGLFFAPLVDRELIRRSLASPVWFACESLTSHIPRSRS